MALRLSLSLMASIVCLLLCTSPNAQAISDVGITIQNAKSDGPLIPLPRSAFTPPHSPDWDPACYRTYEEVQTFLQSIASTYPQLATLTDAGLSWEGTRHLWLLKLTNLSRPGPKPAIFLLAGQRPRDIAGPDMLMRYAAYLTQGYGVDPDITFLLDHKEVYLLPLSNPDGYYNVYANGAFWFKNTDRDDGCTNAQQWGTDLNRNYPFHWGEVGASGAPCDLSYRGPSALSEPESQAILAAIDYANTDLLLSLQAPGPAILYPWGYSSTPVPDAAGLDALGWNLGRLNSTPRSSVRSHNANSPISGLLDDAAYGVYGIPAFTLNIGVTLSPQCTDLPALWEAQRPAFLYATKAAALSMPATLQHAFGPTPRDLSIANLEWSTKSKIRNPKSEIQVTGVINSGNWGYLGQLRSSHGRGLFDRRTAG